MQAKIPVPAHLPDAAAPRIPLGSLEATWRYLGDRDDADRAYCFRFGVSQAPEPMVAPGGAWAYPLPGAEQRP